MWFVAMLEQVYQPRIHLVFIVVGKRSVGSPLFAIMKADTDAFDVTQTQQPGLP